MSDWATVPTLAGVHTTLRPLVPADRVALVTAASTGGLWDLFYASVSQMKDADAFFARVAAEQAAGQAMVFAVLNGDGDVIGTTRLMRMNRPHRRVEVGGTFYAVSAQRTGINTEAKLMLLGHAFDTLGCQCVQIRTDVLNKRSQRAIERLGARLDGVLRGHQIVDGRLRDSVVYSILDREWPGVRQNLRYLLDRPTTPA